MALYVNQKKKTGEGNERIIAHRQRDILHVIILSKKKIIQRIFDALRQSIKKTGEGNERIITHRQRDICYYFK